MEAVMRVRCSQGLTVDHYMGAFYRMPSSPTDVFLPAVDCDKSITASIRITDKLVSGSETYFQSALLYTTTEGERRVRVHTLALPISDNATSVFKAADLDSQIVNMARRLAMGLPHASLVGGRESITTSMCMTLASYRTAQSLVSAACGKDGIKPDVRSLWQSQMLSLPVKRFTTLLYTNHDGVKPDVRSLWQSQMLSLPVNRIIPLLYPRLLDVRAVLLAEEEVPLSDGAPKARREAPTRFKTVVKRQLAKDAPTTSAAFDYPDCGADLLGCATYDDVMRIPTALTLLPRDNPTSQKLQQLLVKVRIQRSSFLRLRVTRKGDLHEVSFFHQLMEDRSTAGLSYIDYLCQVHRLILDGVRKGF
eukprot:gene15089-21144_t